MTEMDLFADCPCSGSTLQRFVQPLVMSLLARGPLHGYVLMQRLGAMPFWGASPPDQAGVYRLLKLMESKHLLASHEESGPTRGRRVFTLTGQGRACLARWETTLHAYLHTVGGVLALVREANTVDRKFMALVERVASDSMRGILPSREDVIMLLHVPPTSQEATFLGRRAREMARAVVGNSGRVWSAIGVDCQPCSMNCGFCSFGEKWGLVPEPFEWPVDRIVETARKFVEQGARWVTLRTTEFYSLPKLLDLVRDLRRKVPGNYDVVVNTGEFGPEEASAMRAAGVTVVYHSLRLGEGCTTCFKVEDRLATLAAVRDSDIRLAHLVEPVGPEHSNEEIADVLLTALGHKAALCGVMARVNVRGTPCGDAAQAELSSLRLAQIAAVTRLAGGVQTPDICVHPPTPEALAWGANVLVVESGAVPRADMESPEEWRDFTVRDALGMLLEAGYDPGGD
ncbi:radical SAM protein, partial [Desulfovibrio sp.]|uniref:helix-turn-helix transcriptional regulator n=1 Tax=Desulfovibrio sp. TaxID=885 RepID=UPI0025B7EE9C